MPIPAVDFANATAALARPAPARQRTGAPASARSGLVRAGPYRAVGGGPAYVFGGSGGAVIGLALVERHPAQVRTLVAHQPLLELLPEEPLRREVGQEIHATYRKEGGRPADGEVPVRLGTR